MNGAGALVSKLNAHSNRLKREKGRTLTAIGNEILEDVSDHFEDEKSSDSMGWKQLSKSRIKQREKINKWPGKMLQVSGRLKNSISMRVSGSKVIVGTNVVYAEAMNKQRRFMWLSREAKKQIIKIYNTYHKFRKG